PPRLSLLIGDCITNARAALDYIVWELASKYFSPRVDLRSREDRRITAFPIFEHSATEQGYKDRLNRLAARQVPAEACAEITAVQPDVSGNQALFWLHELVNHDKHRMPILTIGVFENADIRIPEFRGHAWLIRGEFRNTGLAVKAERDLLSGIQSGHVQVDIEPAVSIGCRNLPLPVPRLDRTLQQIIETVANVIPRFDRFF
ncbi:MAG TPA: hypothetical protein VEL51_21205, partial [Vicinamibacterales bacterium]|nr:hypothetical protein [Vicinamibacterales bacterium]